MPELGGSRPDRLAGVRPQERVPRRIVEQIVDFAPVLPLLHDPVPQTVESVEEVLKIFDKLAPDVEQVVEVPKILQHTVRSSLPEPQTAEQLVAVPVIERVVVARGRGAGGLAWCHCVAHVAHARARHASPGRVYKFWAQVTPP